MFRRGSYRFKSSSEGGFSLIELIIVIAIMTVLIGLIAPNFVRYVNENKKKTCRHNREAILTVYQRCVYDTSVQALNNPVKPDFSTTGLGNVIPNSSGETKFKPIQSEVAEYAKCPVDKTTTYDFLGKYGVEDTGTGTAWIECDKCGDIVSIDMVGGFKHYDESPEPDNPVVTPTPAVSPTAEKHYTIVFDNKGKGKSVGNKTIDSLTNYYLNELPSLTEPYYTFEGWFENADYSGSQFTVPAKIDHDMTLHAKWKHNDSGGTWPVWPYIDDPSWWDGDSFTHADDVFKPNGENITSHNGEDKYVKIKTPTGIFKSKSGAEFVGVGAGSFIEIHEYEAASPEAFIHSPHNGTPSLIQLSGNKKTYDITGKPDEYTIKFLTPVNGDLLIFNDNDTGKSYTYVYWHKDGEADQSITMSDVRSYKDHTANCYAVSSDVDNPRPYD